MECAPLLVSQGHQVSERVSSPGAAAGLVWTSVGGLVQYIECCRVGAGQLERLGSLKLTGQVCLLGKLFCIIRSMYRVVWGSISPLQIGSYSNPLRGDRKRTGTTDTRYIGERAVEFRP